MTQVPGEAEVVLPGGGRRPHHRARMVEEPEVVDRAEVEETDGAEEPAAGSGQEHVETVVEEPEIVGAEQEERPRARGER